MSKTNKPVPEENFKMSTLQEIRDLYIRWCSDEVMNIRVKLARSELRKGSFATVFIADRAKPVYADIKVYENMYDLVKRGVEREMMRGIITKELSNRVINDYMKFQGSEQVAIDCTVVKVLSPATGKPNTMSEIVTEAFVHILSGTR